jgi:hypothetical protein
MSGHWRPGKRVRDGTERHGGQAQPDSHEAPRLRLRSSGVEPRPHPPRRMRCGRERSSIGVLRLVRIAPG